MNLKKERTDGSMDTSFKRRIGAGLLVLACCVNFWSWNGIDEAWAESNNKDRCSIYREAVAENTKFETDLYVIKSGKPGPVVLVSGGVHGNEPAGYKAAEKLKKEQIKCGTLLVLPYANQTAVEHKLRAPKSTGNLNRKFPSSKNGRAEGILAQSILEVMKEYEVDWVVDLHEGYNYSRLKSDSSVGQSIIYYPSKTAVRTAEKVTAALNENIKTPYRKFQMLKYPVQGSLARSGAEICGADSMIIETCTRDTLDTRIQRHLLAVEVILKNLGMK